MLCNGPGFAADPVFTILSLKMHIRHSILDNLAWTTYMLRSWIATKLDLILPQSMLLKSD